MRNLTRSILAIALAGAASLTPAMADTLNVCVNRQSGEMNAIAPGVARAFCPPGTKVAGGGGITSGFGLGLQQSFPISDATGQIAYGDTAIGWQAASDDFGFSQAFVVCVH